MGVTKLGYDKTGHLDLLTPQFSTKETLNRNLTLLLPEEDDTLSIIDKT